MKKWGHSRVSHRATQCYKRAKTFRKAFRSMYTFVTLSLNERLGSDARRLFLRVVSQIQKIYSCLFNVIDVIQYKSRWSNIILRFGYFFMLVCRFFLFFLYSPADGEK